MAMELDDPGFHHSVLADFRDRLTEDGRADRLLDPDDRPPSRATSTGAGSPGRNPGASWASDLGNSKIPDRVKLRLLFLSGLAGEMLILLTSRRSCK